MKVHTQFEQGSSQWTEARCGKVTASEFGKLVTDKLAPRNGQMPRTYLYLKLRETLCGPKPEVTSYAMDQGTLREEDALPRYALKYDCDVTRVGFIEHDDGRCGCSPDGIIEEGKLGLEVKCPQPETHIRYCLENELPEEYAPQVAFSLYVTGYPRWRFFSYCPIVKAQPCFAVTVERDEAVMETIGNVMRKFYADFDAALSKLTTKTNVH